MKISVTPEEPIAWQTVWTMIVFTALVTFALIWHHVEVVRKQTEEAKAQVRELPLPATKEDLSNENFFANLGIFLR